MLPIIIDTIVYKKGIPTRSEEHIDEKLTVAK